MSSQRPTMHSFGGVPSTLPDVPVCSILLALFLAGAILHMRAFIRYKKKFAWSAATFGFCMSRLVALSLRLAWSQHPTNLGLRVASTIFNFAGTILLYIITLQCVKKSIFALFDLSSRRKRAIKMVLANSCLLFLPIIVMLVACASLVQVTANPTTRSRAQKVLKFAQIYQLVYAFASMPLALITFALAMDRSNHTTPVKEGKRTLTVREIQFNLVPLFLLSALLTLEQLIRVIQTFHNPLSYTWLYSRGSFYAFQGAIEATAVFTLLALDMPWRYGRLYRPGSRQEDDEKGPLRQP